MPLEQSSDERLPGVSVTISAYNYAKFLPEAIESVLAQDYPEFELIVVDDGSTDNTSEVVARYGEKVRYVHQKNAGLSAARNTGIKTARYDFISFLDADDHFQPTMLRKIMEAFVKLSRDFAVVACGTSYMDITGRDLETKSLERKSTPEELTCRDFILKNCCSADAVVVRKSAFAECGDYDTTLRSSEDRDMWIRISARKRFYVIPERLLRVRRHPNSMSKHADRMKNNARRVILKAYHSRIVSHCDVVFWLRVFSFLHFQAAWMYRDEGRRGCAIRDMLFSITLWPLFRNPKRLNEPPWFRLRSVIRFSRELLHLA
ncbi:MAG: glycosyltransferase family protein [Verrucomicrobiales bacterium]|nr:glycosyltransferase family protein [Verrucomicrobiales bacterium]